MASFTSACWGCEIQNCGIWLRSIDEKLETNVACESVIVRSRQGQVTWRLDGREELKRNRFSTSKDVTSNNFGDRRQDGDTLGIALVSAARS